MTLGGYDASRFKDSNVTFNFAPDTSRDLVVGIVAIGTAGGSTSLLSKPILFFIDSSVSHIWLPLAACKAFQEAFNLTYDQDLGLYLVNDTVHSSLLSQNVTISFTLSNDLSLSLSSPLVTIDMPYSAFDLQLTADYPNNTNNATYYFPIRQAANQSQYTLGRTFLQESYLIADYEREQFAVHQALFPSAGSKQDLRAILPSNANGTNSTTVVPTSSPDSDGSVLSTGALAGIIVSVGVVVLGILVAGYLVRRHRRQKRHPPLVVDETKPLPVVELASKHKITHLSSTPKTLQRLSSRVPVGGLLNRSWRAMMEL